MRYLRNFGSAILRRLQNFKPYRRIGRQLVPSIILREATEPDMLAVCHWLDPEGTQTPTIQKDPKIINWVADFQGRLVGFVQLTHYPPEYFPYNGFWLFSLIVKTAWRGAGIGERLSLLVIERAKKEGALFLNLLVHDDNLSAIRLYQKLGFESVTIPEHQTQLDKECVDTGRRRVVMQKKLDDRI